MRSAAMHTSPDPMMHPTLNRTRGSRFRENALTFPESYFDVIGPDILVLAVAIGCSDGGSVAVAFSSDVAICAEFAQLVAGQFFAERRLRLRPLHGIGRRTWWGALGHLLDARLRQRKVGGQIGDVC